MAAAAGSRAAIIFVENAGQFAEGTRFLAHERDASLWLAEDGIWQTAFGRTAAMNTSKAANT